MKYATITIFFILSLGYAGYYIYTYDGGNRKNAVDTADPVDKDTLNVEPQANLEPKIIVPEHLTPEFWETLTPEQLKEKLKTIKNVNEIHPENKANMLHFLVQYGQYPEMFSMLVEAGADVHLQNYKTGSLSNKGLEVEGRLHVLCFALKRILQKDQLGIDFITEILKYDQENINRDCIFDFRKAKPIIFALVFRLPHEVVKLLLEKGADVNIYYQDYHKPEKKLSILMTASFFDEELPVTSYIDPKVIQLLIDRGADLKFKDWNGRTAFDYMKENEEFTKTETFKRISTQF